MPSSALGVGQKPLADELLAEGVDFTEDSGYESRPSRREREAADAREEIGVGWSWLHR